MGEKRRKTAIFTKLSCTHPLPHLGHANGELFRAKFKRDRHILFHIATHKHANMTNFVIFRKLLCTHRPIRAKYGTLEYANGQRLHAKFHLDLFTVSPLWVKNQIFPYFQLNHSAVAPPSIVETKLNTLHNYEPSPIQWYQSHFHIPMCWESMKRKKRRKRKRVHNAIITCEQHTFTGGMALYFTRTYNSTEYQ